MLARQPEPHSQHPHCLPTTVPVSVSVKPDPSVCLLPCEETEITSGGQSSDKLPTRTRCNLSLYHLSILLADPGPGADPGTKKNTAGAREAPGLGPEMALLWEHPEYKPRSDPWSQGTWSLC